MSDKNDKRLKWIIPALVVAVAMSALFFFLRGPYLSNSIKRTIIPILESATGERVLIDRVVINLFPFYLQAKGFKMFDSYGNRLLWVAKTRVYIDLIGLVAQKIVVRRLTIEEADLTMSRDEMDGIIHHIQEYMAAERKKRFPMVLRNVKLTKGRFALKYPGRNMNISGKGLYVDVSIKDTATARVMLEEGVLHLQDRPETRYGLDGRIKISNDRIDITEVKISSSGSSLRARGRVSLAPEARMIEGDLSVEARVLAETVSQFFDLELEKDGAVTASGSVRLILERGKKPEIEMDLNTEGWFYLESLMKILKVKKNISGRIEVSGRVYGVFPEVRAKGRARLDKGMLGPLPVDDVEGNLEYASRRFTLNNFTARTYGGELKGDAYILVPRGDFTVVATASEIRSPEFFRFIRWKNAPFPEGRISGDFQLNKRRGYPIEVIAQVEYLNTSKIQGGAIERLKSFKGKVEFKDKVVRLNDSIFSTGLSDLFMDGDIDVRKKNLDLSLRLESRDARDLTMPSFDWIKAPLSFRGKAEGLFKDPEISGIIEIGPGRFRNLPFTTASGDLSYTINSFSVRLLKVSHDRTTYDVSGEITFRKAKRIFSFNDPFFRGKIVLKGGEAGLLISSLYRDIPVSGDVDGEVFLKGGLNSLTGRADLVLRDGFIYGQEFDLMDLKAILTPEGMDFQSVTVHRGNSDLRLRGTLAFNDRFEISASADNISSEDVTFLKGYPVDALFNLELSGSGTLKDPKLKFLIDIPELSIRNTRIGEGEITGEIKSRMLSVKASLLEGLISARASADLAEVPSWNMDINFKGGRYDTILHALLRRESEDISASVEGSIRLKGKGKRVSMQSRFRTVTFSIYGYNFRNKGDLIVDLAGEELRIRSLSLIGDDVDMSAAGVVRIGKDFNFFLKGDLDVAPLRAISSKVKALKGRGDFFLRISGRWDAPDIVGEVNMRGITLSMADFPYRIGPLNGKVFFKKDRFTFESLTSHFEGGRVAMSGVGYLERMSLKRLFVSSVLTGIRLRPVEGLTTVFDGKLFYELSPKGSGLTGDIYIKRARYEKRVEWKKWLFKLKGSKRNAIGQSSTFLGKTTLNLRITGSDISIDNNVARTRVKVDLVLMGTVERYGLMGEVETKEGSLYFRGNEFRITYARVDFVEPNRVVPIFHVKADTTVNGYDIRLDLDGSIERFTLSFLSDPPLSEMDILTLLTSGQVTKGMGGFESGIVASEATAILTGELQEVVEEKFKGVTGLERFEVNPQTTASGSVTPRVTVGKRLLEDKLSVVYSTSIGTTEEHIIRLQYNLGKNISIVGTRDEMGSTGVDIKYRFEFR